MKHVSEPLANVLAHIAKQSEENKARVLQIIADLREQLRANQ